MKIKKTMFDIKYLIDKKNKMKIKNNCFTLNILTRVDMS